ncbi:hypothetical protein [Methanocalculus chunghsingensis]|uniref:hypothetical protein n=1 Tax=Methanocalculus chunghsingensis TaxID=156457 RepID=UPI001B8AEE8C|nr:hypothetical protein [Methanocalculus chunghsingensis]
MEGILHGTTDLPYISLILFFCATGNNVPASLRSDIRGEEFFHKTMVLKESRCIKTSGEVRADEKTNAPSLQTFLLTGTSEFVVASSLFC